MRLLCSILAALLLGPAAVAAQVQSADPGGSVAGHVVTGYGELVPGATVTLAGRTSDNRSERWAAVSDASGAFSFAGIPDGRYRMVVSKDGYTNRQPADPGAPQGLSGPAFAFGREVEVAGGGQMTDLQLILHRSASITGRVVRSDGSAAGNVQVFVASQSANGPRPLMDTRSLSQSDGTYAITGLPPGEYLVGALQVGPTTERTWTWHPGVAGAAPGTVVPLLEGIDATGIDIWLTPPERFNVSGRVFWPVGVNAENITIDYGDPSGRRSGVWVVSDPGGLFTLAGIEPGPLTLLARAESDQGALLGIVTTEVTGDSVDGVQLVVDRPGAIAGRVVYEGTVPQSTRATSIVGVQKLVNVSPLFPVPESPVDELGRFALRGAIGEYELVLDGLARGFSIRQVSRNGVPVPRNRITVAGGEIVDGLEIVVGRVGD